MIRLDSNGSTAVELAAAMPLIALLMLSVVGISSLCVRGSITTLFASCAARAEKVFQGNMARAELYAMLTPDFTGEIDVDWHEPDGSKRIRNWNFGRARVKVIQTGLPILISADLLTRDSPTTPALPKNLSSAILSGGDTPSPYCRNDMGYYVCGYNY